MQQPAFAEAVPIATGITVLIAGIFQFTPWKARRLTCCRQSPAQAYGLSADAGSAWRYGLRIGLECCYCCAGLTAILLVIGVMDLTAMAVVTVAISLERLAPHGERISHLVGVVSVAAGLLLIARAVGLA